MASLDDLVPVQASDINEVKNSKSPTELGRQVASHLNWLIQLYDGSIHDPEGAIIATSIEDFTSAAQDLGWIAPDGNGLRASAYSAIQFTNEEAAEKVRTILGYPQEQPWG